MRPGYTHPLYLLSLDTRHSYPTGMPQPDTPSPADGRATVTDGKEVIYDGFRQALGHAVPVASAGILIEDDVDADILRDAGRRGHVTALTIEKAGSVGFERGPDFASHIAPFKPTFARALVRYNPEGDPAANRRQTARLKELSDYCRAVRQRFIVELVVPSIAAQQERVAAFGSTYDLLLRPALTVHSIRLLQDAGVEPDVWAIQGLERRTDCEHVVATVRRAGRNEVCCIVLAHDTEHERTASWLETAASVPGFNGFAAGRVTYRSAVAAYVAKQVTRQEAVSLVARRYREWVAVFERARGRHVRTA